MLQRDAEESYSTYRISSVSAAIWAVQLDHFKLFCGDETNASEDMAESYTGMTSQNVRQKDLKIVGRTQWCTPTLISSDHIMIV